jgi:hypothetical protein
MKESSFVIVNRVGQCRWCRCTDDHACANGCSWANAQRTLCSECVPLDKAMQTTAGRRELAEFLQANSFLVGQMMPAAARPSHVPNRQRNAQQRVGGRDRR